MNFLGSAGRLILFPLRLFFELHERALVTSTDQPQSELEVQLNSKQKDRVNKASIGT